MLYGEQLLIEPDPDDFPVSLDELKAHCSINTDQFDTLLESYLANTIQYVENDLGRVIVPQTWRFSFDEFPLTIPKPRTVSILSFQYRDTDNEWQDLDPETYSLDSYAIPAKLRYETLPTIGTHTPRVIIDCLCDWNLAPDDEEDPPAPIPGDIVDAIRLVAAYRFMQREASVHTLGAIQESQWGYRSIMHKYKVWNI